MSNADEVFMVLIYTICPWSLCYYCLYSDRPIISTRTISTMTYSFRSHWVKGSVFELQGWHHQQLLETYSLTQVNLLQPNAVIKYSFYPSSAYRSVNVNGICRTIGCCVNYYVGVSCVPHLTDQQVLCNYANHLKVNVISNLVTL